MGGEAGKRMLQSVCYRTIFHCPTDTKPLLQQQHLLSPETSEILGYLWLHLIPPRYIFNEYEPLVYLSVGAMKPLATSIAYDIRLPGLLLACHLIAVNVSCSASKNPAENEPGTTNTLLPDSALVSGCYNWPDQSSSQDNNTGGLRISVKAGEPAIDFTLKDINGKSHTLSALLETKPVLMVFGSYT